MSIQVRVASGVQSTEQDQTILLANILSAKSDDEIEQIANSNPELIREWLYELQQSRDEAQYKAETLREAILVLMKASNPYTQVAA
ncbi:MAG: hypothetical protein ACR2PH_12830 [Desulfobulbia bacterium]